MTKIMAMGLGLAALILFSWLGKADAGAASDQSKKDDKMEVKRGYAPSRLRRPVTRGISLLGRGNYLNGGPRCHSFAI